MSDFKTRPAFLAMIALLGFDANSYVKTLAALRSDFERLLRAYGG